MNARKSSHTTNLRQSSNFLRTKTPTTTVVLRTYGNEIWMVDKCLFRCSQFEFLYPDVVAVPVWKFQSWKSFSIQCVPQILNFWPPFLIGETFPKLHSQRKDGASLPTPWVLLRVLGVIFYWLLMLAEPWSMRPQSPLPLTTRFSSFSPPDRQST